MAMSATTLAELMQSELEKLDVDPEQAALWHALFTALSEAIVAHIEDNAEVIDSDNDPTGDTIR
tara:strand:+ start:599 stop:790 length:192 start_codon:yes stop_codon:yes gene_type:complete